MEHKQIIDGIEGIFRKYQCDEKLREALKGSHQHLLLFGHEGIGYFLTPDREILKKQGFGLYFSSPRDAAQDFFERKSPCTLTGAKAMLEEDLGARVEALKKSYAQHFEV